MPVNGSDTVATGQGWFRPLQGNEGRGDRGEKRREGPRLQGLERYIVPSTRVKRARTLFLIDDPGLMTDALDDGVTQLRNEKRQRTKHWPWLAFTKLPAAQQTTSTGRRVLAKNHHLSGPLVLLVIKMPRG